MIYADTWVIASPSHLTSFWPTVCKTVCPMLSDRCLSCPILSCPVCLSVWLQRLLWPNGCMDQDETWHGGRPRPRPQCVTRGPSSPKKGAQPRPQFPAHVCCGQTAGWIKMPLGTEVCLGPGDTVLDGDPSPPAERGTAAPLFSAYVYCAKRSPISATAVHLLFRSVRCIATSVTTCLFAHVYLKTTRQTFTKFSVHVARGRGSILFWWQCNTLCISGFVNDVNDHGGIFAFAVVTDCLTALYSF